MSVTRVWQAAHWSMGADLTAPLELSSLPRDDLPCLKFWLASCGVAVGAGDVDAPVRRGGGEGGAAADASATSDSGDDDEGDDSDEDDEFDPDAVSVSSRDSDESGTDDEEEGGGGQVFFVSVFPFLPLLHKKEAQPYPFHSAFNVSVVSRCVCLNKKMTAQQRGGA